MLILTVQQHRCLVSPEEAGVIIRGDVPPALADLLRERGVLLPRRGTIEYDLAFPEGRTVHAYCRVDRTKAQPTPRQLSALREHFEATRL